MRKGDRVRFRLINAATARTFKVRIGGGAGAVVAQDGMPLAAPEPIGEPVLAPAQRTDIVLDVAGPVTFHLLPRGEPYPLGTVAVEGSNPAPPRGPVEPLPPTAVPTPDAKGARRLTLAMEGGADGRTGTGATISGPSTAARACRTRRGSASRAARRRG